MWKSASNTMFGLCLALQRGAGAGRRLAASAIAGLALLLVSLQAYAANGALFVSNNVPTTMTAGEKYTVIIVMKNNGTTSWTVAGGFLLGSQSPQGNTTWGPATVALGSTYAVNAQKSFSIAVTAPSQPGTYNFQWQMMQSGVPFGDATPNVAVNVVAPIYDAQFVSQGAATAVAAATNRTFSVTMKNTGNTTWSATDPVLAPIGAAAGWAVVTAPVGAAVAPGGQRTYSLTLKSPAELAFYDMQWQMKRQSGTFFGEPSDILRIGVMGAAPALTVLSPTAGQIFTTAQGKITISVNATAVPTGVATISKMQLMYYNGTSYYEVGSVDDSNVFNQPVEFSPTYTTVYVRATDSFGKFTQVPINNIKWISDTASMTAQTVPTKMTPGQPYNMSITMKNTGGTTWYPGSHSLAAVTPVDNTTWGTNSLSLDQEVAPGGSATFNATVTAPSTVGTYTFQWRMREATRGLFFNNTTAISIVVARPLPVVTMSAPVDNETYTMPAGESALVTVRGSAVLADGATIRTLEVLDGTTVIHSVETPSIDTTLVLAPGNHPLKLRATDNWGIVGVSTVADVVVKSNGAAFSSQSVPATLIAGQTFTATVSMKNTGSTSWVPLSATNPQGYALASQNPQDNDAWRLRATIAATVAPAQTVNFSVGGTAPSTPGVYNFQWQMLQEGREYFGPITPAVQVTVKPTLPVATLSSPVTAAKFTATAGKAEVAFAGSGTPGAGGQIVLVELLDAATVLQTAESDHIEGTVQLAAGTHSLRLRTTDNFGQIAYSAYSTVTVQTHSASFSSKSVPSTMVAGQTYEVSVSMYNNGSATWSTAEGYMLGSQSPEDNEIWGRSRVPLATTVANNVTTKLTFSVVAPATAGTYPFQWQMLRDGYEWFGAKSTLQNVVVTGAPPTATLISPTPNATYAGIGLAGIVRLQGSGQAFNGATVAKLEVLDGTTVVATVAADTIDTSIPMAFGTHSLTLRTTDSRGITAVSAAAPINILRHHATFVSQSVPEAMVAGDTYTVSVTMRNTGNSTWQPYAPPQGFAGLGIAAMAAPMGTATGFSLASKNPFDNTIWRNGRVPLTTAVAPNALATFTFDVVAPQGLGIQSFQWQVIDEALGVFGFASDNVPVAVTPPVLPVVTMTATPSMSRIQAGQIATITMVGSATVATGEVRKMEVFRDSGNGFGNSPVFSFEGAAATLLLNDKIPLYHGTYRLKLRATDAAGRFGESAPVMVTVTDDRLEGAVSGIRILSGQPRLVSWVMMDPAGPALLVKYYVKAPRAFGGIEIGTGMLGVAPPAQGPAQPKIRREFDFGVEEFNTLYPGEPIFVEVLPATGGDPVLLPNEGGTTVMPGTLRIGLTSPSASNDDHTREPSPVFLRAVVSGATGAPDEVTFNVDGSWIPGVSEGGGAYSVQKTGLAARVAAYKTYAKVKQGDVTLLTEERLFYVDGGSSISLLSPVAGAKLTIGVPVTLSAQPAGDLAAVHGVTFYVNGQVVGAGVNNAGNWTYQWTPTRVGAHQLRATAYDGNGVPLSQVSSATPVTVVAQEVLPPELLPVLDKPAHLDDDDAGTLSGGLTVTPSGAASYSMPLAVPPGTAGVQPALSLNYNSSGPNSTVGLGWSLGGLSRIHRCAKTFAQDEINGRVSFENSDRLCLDGQRLLLVNKAVTDANYWSDDAEYRTELDTFARIRAQGAGVAERTFVVHTKDMRVLTFGKGTAVVKAYGAVKSGAQAWALERTEDRIGNHIIYSYQQDETSGEHLISRISYGGKGKSAHAAVDFEYEDRPDAWKRYIDETRNDLRKRISHIRTSATDDDPDRTVRDVSDYQLTYEHSPTSGRSLLKQVKVCARHPDTAAIECLPPTKFEWGKPAAGKTAGFVSIGDWANAPVLTTHGRWDNQVVSTNHADYFSFADFDNDGLMDALEKRVASPVPADAASPDGMSREATNSITPGTMATQYAYYHNTGKAATGFARYNFKLKPEQQFAVLEVGDFNGDGAPDLLASTSSGARICISPLNNASALDTPGSTIVFDCENDLKAVGDNTSFGQPYVVDVTGDGRAAHYSSLNENNISMLCIGNQECAADPNPPWRVLNLGRQDFRTPPQPLRDYSSFTQMVDFTGVGKPYDVRWSSPHYYQAYDTDGSKFGDPEWLNPTPTIAITGFRRPGFDTVAEIQDYVYPEIPCTVHIDGCRRYMFQAPYQGAGMSADFNGSGYNSLAFGFIELTQTPGPLFKRAETTVCLSTGRKLDCNVRTKYSNTAAGNNYRLIHAVGNYIGDGQASLLVEKMSYETNVPRSTGQMQMCTLMGDDTNGTVGSDSNMICNDWSVPALPEVNNTGNTAKDQGYFMDLLGTGRVQIVKYHSGKAVNGVWVGGDRWEVFEPVDVAEDKQALDRIHQVTNGLGAVSSVEYMEGVADGLVSISSAAAYSYPRRLRPAVGKLVSQLSVGNGVGGPRRTSYRYVDPALDARGRGMLGFAKVIATDEQPGSPDDVVTTTLFSQTWPHVGSPKEIEVKFGDVVLSKTVNEFDAKVPVYLNSTQNWAPFLKQRKVERRDLNNAELGTVVIDFQMDGFGNVETETSTTTGQPVGGVQQSFVVTTSRVFDNQQTSWLIGMVTDQKVTSRANGGQSKMRYLNFEYDANGQLKKEVLEPLNEALNVVTVYSRAGNGFGLVDFKEQSWKDPVTTQTSKRKVVSTTYDDHGRYPATVTNAMGHAEDHTYYPATGARKSLKGPNLLTTNWTVDGFGRVREERRADGGVTKHYVKRCTANCPEVPIAATVQIVEQFNGTNRISEAQMAYSDSVGHLIRTQTVGFARPASSTSATYVDRQYDALGRMFWISQPAYYDNAAPEYASHLAYDELGRVISSSSMGEDGRAVTNTTSYNGYTITYTNARGFTRTEERNVIGQLVKVTDARGGTTKFEYDAFGNLEKTTDPLGHVITVGYDLYGRKTELKDPDLGHIQYSVDPVGRMYKQISPKGHVTSYVHDELDRMKQRTEVSLTSYWKYDSATKGIGQLAETYTGTELTPDYRRTHSYDSLGRPAINVIKLAGVDYTSSVEYDLWGRQSAQVYKRGDGVEKRYTSHYNNRGYLSKITRGTLALWTVREQDAANRVTEVLLGNGLVGKRTYNPYTTRLDSISVVAGADRRLETSYEYDKIGNVTKRTQDWSGAGFKEEFTYDSLSRLATSHVEGRALQSFTYTDDGGILNKTGVGSGDFSYPAAVTAVRPHAVTSIPGIGAFTYDANGNLESGNGRSISWTSFDMPDVITMGGVSSSFHYGSDHQRINQTRGDSSVIWYAGAQEVEIKGGKTTVKTYWPSGLGVEIDDGATTKLFWTHQDHLGSPVATTAEDGSVADELAYDAWGKRRSADGSSTSNDLEGKVDNKGYTSHEMLDQLDLVHMNGRVYDPLLAKFLSGDPLIQDPLDGQNYNRYSYVLNNPTNLTDPTGFASDPSKSAEEKRKFVSDKCTGSAMGLACRSAYGAFFEATEILAKALNELNPVGRTTSAEAASPNTTVGGGGAAERTVESHRSNMEAGNGAVYEPLQPYAVAVTGAALGGSGFAALATTSAGRAFLVMLGFASEVEGLGEGGGVGGSIKGVNKYTKGTTNCGNCAIATDAVLAGRPASALASRPIAPAVLEAHFGAKFGEPTTINGVTAAMNQAGFGAQGIVFGYRGPNTVGHYFNVVNQRGMIRYVDGQSGGAASLEGFKSFQLLRTN